MKTIIANIPARKLVKNGKTWKFDAYTSVFTQDDSGKWTGDGIGSMLEDEVVDACKKASNWAQINKEHFPMVSFQSWTF